MKSWAKAIVAVSLPCLSAHAETPPLFLTSDNCQACHNGLLTAKGEDVSIGVDWRGTMMAQSARDPYWQAGVRRETLDHPKAASAIEHECSICHMPMAHVQARTQGRQGQVFANLGRTAQTPVAAAAQDGVSCTVCHQIEPDNLGKPQSFVGGFTIDTASRPLRKAMGPFDVKPELARLMASATRFLPSKAAHVQGSELCATCHTLITEALGPDGKPIGRLPEQVPYLEWQASSYAGSVACQTCHMPEASSKVAIANLLAEPRGGVLRHEFLGGNFVVPALLKRLAPAMPAQPQDLDRASASARAHLAEAAAKLAIGEPAIKDDRLEARIVVENQAGHKLPTAYPSRRVWLHITVKDGDGVAIFESGAMGSNGAIAGNDNDESPARFEPHHTVLEKSDEVQIYEAILGDSQGKVTTGLLKAVRFLKDNRLLPAGFEKEKAAADVAVHGEALGDADFKDGGDELLLRVPVGGKKPPFKVEAELLYQTIGHRWAENLRSVDAAEPRAFLRLFDAVAATSSQRLARAERVLP